MAWLWLVAPRKQASVIEQSQLAPEDRVRHRYYDVEGTVTATGTPNEYRFTPAAEIVTGAWVLWDDITAIYSGLEGPTWYANVSLRKIPARPRKENV